MVGVVGVVLVVVGDGWWLVFGGSRGRGVPGLRGCGVAGLWGCVVDGLMG